LYGFNQSNNNSAQIKTKDLLNRLRRTGIAPPFGALKFIPIDTVLIAAGQFTGGVSHYIRMPGRNCSVCLD